MLGDAWVHRALASRTPFNADFQAMITRYAWHEVWGRPSLDHRTRRLLVVAMTASLGRWEEFRLHVRAGLEQGGFTQDELKEVLLETAVYAGSRPPTRLSRRPPPLSTRLRPKGRSRLARIAGGDPAGFVRELVSRTWGHGGGADGRGLRRICGLRARVLPGLHRELRDSYGASAPMCRYAKRAVASAAHRAKKL
ncbi:carboxymuconolactone decarboxylase family protein [Phenylobacterium sp.]|uniref:carboxymuconolactone decarboxylase family protein n=1 Tax=Phenylobacterium sp. TaxID=1871053 RepID=UPI002ED7C045